MYVKFRCVVQQVKYSCHGIVVESKRFTVTMIVILNPRVLLLLNIASQFENEILNTYQLFLLNLSKKYNKLLTFNSMPCPVVQISLRSSLICLIVRQLLTCCAFAFVYLYDVQTILWRQLVQLLWQLSCPVFKNLFMFFCNPTSGLRNRVVCVCSICFVGV